MKKITSYITEKLRINQNTKIKNYSIDDFCREYSLQMNIHPDSEKITLKLIFDKQIDLNILKNNIQTIDKTIKEDWKIYGNTNYVYMRSTVLRSDVSINFYIYSNDDKKILWGHCYIYPTKILIECIKTKMQDLEKIFVGILKNYLSFYRDHK